jgi:AAA+ ATPase superfamily predicted ATPase
MKFYDREAELQLLEDTRKVSEISAKMTIVVGRRRIGKTSLISEAFKDKKFLYFFIARKNEALLCEEFIAEVAAKIEQPLLGDFKSFSKLFEFLLVVSQNEPFTLVLDEFQEFININPAVYSEMQNLWDQYKNRSKMNLVMSGSVYSLMKKIFENSKEPLFGRANEKIRLKPFSILTLKQIIGDQNPTYKPDDLLAFFILTGGVAKYAEIMVDKNRLTLNKMLNEIFRENSLLIDEGKNVLIEEFGKEYATYFSILSLIASSRTLRSEIESILEKNVGGFLDRLEKEYQIIRSVRPLFSKQGSRSVKYYIDDNFLNFWFRFIYKYRSALEIGNFNYVREIVERDYETYSGPFLEKYFREKLALSGEYSQIGRYWSARNQNELDVVAINEFEKKALIAEVKRNKNKININKLKEQSVELARLLPGYEIQYTGFSMEDMMM